MKRWRWMLLLFFVALSLLVDAQQDPLYSQYQFNTLVVNPAFAGTKGVMSAMVVARQQWVGFEGAPSTQAFTLHTPFPYRHVSLGVSLVHDQLKPLSQTALFADYAYALYLGRETKLSMGLKGGVSRVLTDLASLNPEPGSSDPVYQVGSDSRLLPNFGFGLYLYNSRFFAGISVPKLLENDLSSDLFNQAILSGHEVRHYFITGGWMVSLSEEWKIKPSLMARVAEAAPWSVDVNLNALYSDRLMLGVMYRPGSAIGSMIQFQVNDRWRMGYAVEISTNQFRQYNEGTHEIMLGYELSFKNRKVSNPRFL